MRSGEKSPKETGSAAGSGCADAGGAGAELRERRLPHAETRLVAASTGSIAGTGISDDARQARMPPSTPPSVPPPATQATAGLPVCGSKRSLTYDQNAEISGEPNSAVYR